MVTGFKTTDKEKANEDVKLLYSQQISL